MSICKRITMKWKIFFALFSICALWPQKTSVIACGFYTSEEEMRFMLLNPDLTDKKVWWNYFYSREYNYLYGETFVNDDEDELAREWKNKIGTNDELPVVRDCIFGALTDSALEKNSFHMALNKDKSAKEYFEFARRSQEVSILGTSWEEQDETDKRNRKRSEVTNTIHNIFQKESEPFFKRKYAFQLIRLSYYSADWKMLDEMYQSYFARGKHDVLYWWATHYKSMKFERLDQMDSANYLHALIFSKSSNKMRPSKEFFSRKNLDRVLALAQDDLEKADIYLISEIINPGRALEGIKRVYELNPKHKHLGLLITREINKLEHWLGTSRYSENQATIENYKSDLDYLREFTAFLSQADDYRANEPSLYHFGLGYVYLMDGNNEEAKKHIESIKPDDAGEQFQQAILRTLLIAQSKDISRSDVQDEIGKQFEYLLSNRFNKFESQKMLFSLSSYLRSLFAQKGLIELAGLFDNYAANKFCYTCHHNSFEYSMVGYWDRYATSGQVSRLISLYHKEEKNALETVLFKPYSNANYLYDLLSVKYLREGKVDDAMKTLQKVPNNFWLSFANANYTLDKDPFKNNEALFDVPTMDIYSKREIVEKLYTLEQEAIKIPSKRATNYLLLGNAWYNFTEHSWFMVSYGWSDGQMINAPDLVNVCERKAFAYYKQAMQYEKSEEMRARIAYMMAETASDRDKKTYAREFEQHSGTMFYQRRNCTITKELAQQN
jgi:hypothetical protein